AHSRTSPFIPFTYYHATKRSNPLLRIGITSIAYTSIIFWQLLLLTALAIHLDWKMQIPPRLLLQWTYTMMMESRMERDFRHCQLMRLSLFYQSLFPLVELTPLRKFFHWLSHRSEE